MKKFISVLLSLMMVIMLGVCGINNNQTDVSNTESTVDTEINNSNTTEPEWKPNGPLIEQDALGDSLCVTKNNILFSKVITMNGYSFILGCNFEEWLQGVNGHYLYTEEFQIFQEDKTEKNCWVECYIENDGQKSKFEALVEYNEGGELILVSLIFDPINASVDDLCFDLKAIDVDMNNAQISAFHEDIQNVAKYVEGRDTYSISLISYYDNYSCVITMSNLGGQYCVTRFSISGK